MAELYDASDEVGERIESYTAGLQYEFKDEFLPKGMPQVITFKVVEENGEVVDILDMDY